MINNRYLRGIRGMAPYHPSVAYMPPPLRRYGSPYFGGGGQQGGQQGGQGQQTGGGTTRPGGGLQNYARINIRTSRGLLAAAQQGAQQQGAQQGPIIMFSQQGQQARQPRTSFRKRNFASSSKPAPIPNMVNWRRSLRIGHRVPDE